MNNQGKITVFLSLIISSMLLIGIAAINIINGFTAKEKSAIAARSAVSSVKAGYNRYIFEHYHILLFDKDSGGMGEAALEEKILFDIKENLGEKFSVEDVAITDFKLIQDDECKALKEQISEYMGYAAVEYGADKILEATNGMDGSISEELFGDMENSEIKVSEENASTESTAAEGDQLDTVDDPRDFTSDLDSDGILSIVLPEDMQISRENVNLSGTISIEEKGFLNDIYLVDSDFDDYSNLKKDLKSHGTWKNSIVDAGLGIVYARNVFNCAVNTEVNAGTVFECELEYLICGKSSDYENLKAVINKLIAVRLPINFAYLLSDSSKMSQISAISGPLSIATLIPEPILKNLLAGCWSYVEAIADLRCLMKGNSMPFAKNRDCWITDLNNIAESIYSEDISDDNGMCYEDYLMILMSLDTDTLYYRMLDLMELNARQEDDSFRIKNGAVELDVDINISFGTWNYYISELGKY